MATPSPFATEDGMSHFTLRQTPQPIQWATLFASSVVFVAAFELIRLPAALMLGAIGAAVLLCWFEGKVTIPPWGFVMAQGFIGCLVARAITTDIIVTIFQRWPMFLTLIGAVILFAAALGYVLTRLKVLPGTTAVWGSSAGAATAMVLMSGAFGGACRPGLSAGWRGSASFDRLVSACGARPSPGDFGLGRGRRNRWGQIQDSRRRAARADVRRRTALS